jgi:hypothetical protein
MIKHFTLKHFTRKNLTRKPMGQSKVLGRTALIAVGKDMAQFSPDNEPLDIAQTLATTFALKPSIRKVYKAVLARTQSPSSTMMRPIKICFWRISLGESDRRNYLIAAARITALPYIDVASVT